MRWRKLALLAGALLLGLVIATAGGLLAWRAMLQHEVSERRKITGPGGIDVMETVEIGGIPQVVRIRGRSLANPVLLFVHGGPGTPMIPFAHRFQDRWEADFTVVQWDQRAAGKTAVLSDQATIAKTISPARMEADVLEMTDYLRARFKKPKIFLLGHSWGSIISIPTVLHHPDRYYAYIGTGQVTDVPRAEALNYAHTLLEAERMGEKAAVRELKSIAPYPPAGPWRGERLDVRHKWNAYFGESVFGFRDMADAMALYAWESPDYNLGDFWRLLTSSDDVYDNLDLFIYNYKAVQFGVDWKVPVIIINGRWDYQISNQVAYEYFQQIRAPLKKWFYLERSAHAPMVEEADAFADILIKEVKPLANASTGATP